MLSNPIYINNRHTILFGCLCIVLFSGPQCYSAYPIKGPWKMFYSNVVWWWIDYCKCLLTRPKEAHVLVTFLGWVFRSDQTWSTTNKQVRLFLDFIPLQKLCSRKIQIDGLPLISSLSSFKRYDIANDMHEKKFSSHPLFFNLYISSPEIILQSRFYFSGWAFLRWPFSGVFSNGKSGFITGGRRSRNRILIWQICTGRNQSAKKE